jgi:hypothetical protein
MAATRVRADCWLGDDGVWLSTADAIDEQRDTRKDCCYSTQEQQRPLPSLALVAWTSLDSDVAPRPTYSALPQRGISSIARAI